VGGPIAEPALFGSSRTGSAQTLMWVDRHWNALGGRLPVLRLGRTEGGLGAQLCRRQNAYGLGRPSALPRLGGVGGLKQAAGYIRGQTSGRAPVRGGRPAFEEALRSVLEQALGQPRKRVTHLPVGRVMVPKLRLLRFSCAGCPKCLVALGSVGRPLVVRPQRHAIVHHHFSDLCRSHTCQQEIVVDRTG
jgi:hypothetical protein